MTMLHLQACKDGWNASIRGNVNKKFPIKLGKVIVMRRTFVYLNGSRCLSVKTSLLWNEEREAMHTRRLSMQCAKVSFKIHYLHSFREASSQKKSRRADVFSLYFESSKLSRVSWSSRHKDQVRSCLYVASAIPHLMARTLPVNYAGNHPIPLLWVHCKIDHLEKRKFPKCGQQECQDRSLYPLRVRLITGSIAYCPKVFDLMCCCKEHPKTCPECCTQSDRRLNKTWATACPIAKLTADWYLYFIVNITGHMYSTPPPLTKPGVQKDEYS